uniref:Uncharacterized protein n=1 Tax=Meloidogyne enterolobii TaxID=390850 RepID=A0A6V7TNF5_MELEN|nr:unnamed protein product [Meloidogyne enterolobii]
MFSSSTKICLFFLSIFILFQLNNGNNCTDEICSDKQRCMKENDSCDSPSETCCPGLICTDTLCQYPPCSGLGAKCDKHTKCCVHLSCQRSHCHTCFSLGVPCDPKNNRCCDTLHCDKTNKICIHN